jgi:hypothetical protein
MAVDDRTYPWAHRWSGGTLRLKQFFNFSFGYTQTHKKVSVGAVADVLAATATVVAGRTITSGITNPDVPRALTITTGGTTADIAAGAVEITGTNVEGKTIVESFVMADNLNGSVTGIQAFKSVTSIVFPAADGTSATISVGTSNKLGVNHRLIPGKTSVGILSDADIDGTNPVQQGQPTVVTDGEQVEYNLVTPATTPGGTTFLVIYYWYHNITIDTIDDDPEYATSTSTSSSTSTSISTSTSRSTSTSSTSISTSSTSLSTSSTSTSTTTLP